jgi:hypothetical protein
MSYITYNGIECKCPACDAEVSKGDASMHVLWSNRHGSALRIFCDVCGKWSDRKLVSGIETIRIFQPRIPHPGHVARVFEVADKPDGGCDE